MGLLFFVVMCRKPEPCPPIIVTPAEVIPEPKPNPANISFTTNAQFHEISWEYFRWLTQKVDGGKLRFETLPNASSIDPGYKEGQDHVLSLAVKSPKGSVLAGINQAASDGILVDQNNRAIYTSIYINETYRDFVLENKLNTPAGLRGVDSTLNFPVGSFSLKVAWKIVGAGEEVSNFYTKKAKVSKLANKDGKIVLTDKPIEETVALVGFHIAVAIKGHPEMVWATFEHNQNAPDLVEGQMPGDEVAATDYTFYKSRTLASACNDKAEPIIKLNEETQEITPITQVFRQYRLGGGTSVNQNNIDRLNDVFHNKMAANSVWRNYREIGAIWFNQSDALKPNSSFASTDTLLTGSKRLSNSTIETFTQRTRDLDQCFGCHNTTALVAVPTDAAIVNGKNVLTSHVLIVNYLKQLDAARESKP